MPFQWNVQPFEKLSELRETYTQALISTTRYMAEGIAPEAEQWMKQTAPWKDVDIWRGRGANKRIVFPAGNARKHLRVDVVTNPSDEQLYAEGFTAANRREQSLLKKINTERSKKKQIALKKVPTKKSPIAAFQKRFKVEKAFIVQLRFRHGPTNRVPYALWLEIANQGRYGIISKAIDYWSSRLMNDIRSMVNLKQFQKTDLSSVVTKHQPTAEDFQRYVEREIAAGENYSPFDPARHRENVLRRRRERQIRREKQRTGGFYTRKTRSDKR